MKIGPIEELSDLFEKLMIWDRSEVLECLDLDRIRLVGSPGIDEYPGGMVKEDANRQNFAVCHRCWQARLDITKVDACPGDGDKVSRPNSRERLTIELD